MNSKYAYITLVFLLVGSSVALAGQSRTGVSPAADNLSAANTPEATNTQPTQHAPALQRRDPRYRLCAGDQMTFEFPFSPQFNQSVTIQPDGYISLRDIGDMHVEGETTPELAAAVKNAYSAILQEPSVTVELTNFNQPYYTVGGQVGKPGKFELRGETTVTEAIAIAGGFTQNSKHSQVLLFRRVSADWAQVKQLNVKKMLRDGNLSEDMFLQPGDMIYVPQNTISKINPYMPWPRASMYVNPQTF